MANAGLVSLSYQDTIILDITSPIADAGPDQSFNEDAAVLDGSASFDENGIASYEWTFTDVTPKILTGANPTYTFANPGICTITLEVTDPAGNSATDIVVITVLDVTKPTVNAGQDQTVNVGATVTFDAGGSSDNVGIVSYEWDFGDGTSKAGVTASHTYTSPGTYTVTLTVKDAAGNADTASITITVISAGAPPIGL
ncbi:MAG: PKD domain-containing protein [Candidatus Methanomethylicaceae archaeon]